MSYLRRTLAMDLGTASVLVYRRSKGIVVNEPAVVAMNLYTNKIVAIGKEAKEMLGKTPGFIVAKRPLKDGVIADFNATEKMIKYFMQKSIGKTLLKPNLIICVPSGINQVQRRAVIQASKLAGANKTFLIEEPLAAAYGCDIDVTSSKGSLVIDIGGGTTDVAVIAMGGMVVSKSIKTAGDECDAAISDYIKKKFNMVIGDTTAENLKVNIGNKETMNEDNLIEVKGRNLLTGLPMHIFITINDIMEAISRPINEIVETVHSVLEKTPPELAADLYDEGVYLTGGGALIKGLDEKLQNKIGIPVIIPNSPETMVVKGTDKYLKNMDKFEDEINGIDQWRFRFLEEKQKERRF